MRVRAAYSANRNGFSLVALIVIIAVVAALVLGLLIPFILSAREEARRAQCANNLKMILLACHNFHDVCDYFPPSRAGESLGRYQKPGLAGHFVWILPFVESNPLYSKIQEARLPNPRANESGVYSVDYPPYRCPSDGGSRLSSWINNAGKANYCGSWGDSICQTDESSYKSRGFFQGGIFKDEENPDAEPRVVARKMAEITDGTSYTVAYSEIVAGDVERSKRVKGGIALLSDAAKIVVPQNVLNVAKGNALEGDVCAFTRGQCWADGSVSVTGFQTILPPNSPSARMFAENEKAGAGAGICSASSYHPGGVNVAMADGSVRFVANTVYCGDLSADVDGSEYPTTEESHGKEFSDKSPFGVWGALGTINGDEIALP